MERTPAARAPRHRLAATTVVAAAAAGVALGWVLHPGAGAAGPSGETERAHLRTARLTSPFVEPAGSRDGDARLRGLEDALEGLAARERAADPTLQVSVYVRDLERGGWGGIDEARSYVPASLMKVAVLFHTLTRLEADPALAASTRRYPGPEAMSSPANLTGDPAGAAMTPGAEYTVRELLERMVVHSDNHAKDLLLQGEDPRAVDRLLAELDVPARFDEDGRAVMTPRAYAALFRMLYHSTVFSRHTSEYALELLSRADFRDGLRAGVPGGVAVASKYGVHFDPSDLEAGQQLHECGIVYAPSGPFTLCVMTRSLTASTDRLATVVADVTRLAYRAMDRVPPGRGVLRGD